MLYEQEKQALQAGQDPGKQVPKVEVPGSVEGFARLPMLALKYRVTYFSHCRHLSQLAAPPGSDCHEHVPGSYGPPLRGPDQSQWQSLYGRHALGEAYSILGIVFVEESHRDVVVSSGGGRC